MSSRNRQTRTAAKLLAATGSASASVIAARVLAFSNPATVMSTWHQAELHRMTSEKLAAGSDGLLAAATEVAKLPGRLLQLAARPSACTPSGWINAWMDCASLWIGIGNAGLAPARSTVVRNRTRLVKHPRT